MTTSPGSSSSAIPILYPCDRGTGVPIGWHFFVTSIGGVPVCAYCGQYSTAISRHRVYASDGTADNFRPREEAG